MSFKTALVIIGSGHAKSDLAQAIDVAAEVDAHLSILVVGLAIAPTIGEFETGAAWLSVREGDQKVLEGIRMEAEASCQANGVSFDVDVIYTEGTFMEQEIHRRALYADLLMIGDGVRRDEILIRRIVGGGLFEAHRPLLLMPGARRASLKPKKVLIGWNSRPEAARAVREALDLLKGADEVRVVLVDPDTSAWINGGEPGADIATYLARHGINVVVQRLASGGRKVDDLLTQHAMDIDADLVVMGAYGHSRLHERVFGGATASVLKGNTFPILLAR